MEKLGKKIRLLRHGRGWSQETVAKRLGISVPAYSKIETGITDISYSRLKELAAVFEMTELDLLATAPKGNNVMDLKKLYAKLNSKERELLELQQEAIRLLEELRK